MKLPTNFDRGKKNIAPCCVHISVVWFGIFANPGNEGCFLFSDEVFRKAANSDVTKAQNKSARWKILIETATSLLEGNREVTFQPLTVYLPCHYLPQEHFIFNNVRRAFVYLWEEFLPRSRGGYRETLVRVLSS